MDLITIKALQVETIIGVLPEEKITPQLLLLDLQVKADLKPAGKSDCLKETIDYSQVAGFIVQFARQNRFELLEAFAEQLITQLLQKFQPRQVKLKIKKPQALPNAKYAAVTIQRKYSPK